MSRTIAVTLLTLAVTLGAAGQRIDESVQVTIVEVPVTVVDRDGKAVSGLTAASFELYDEGKRVPIDYFEVLDLSAKAAAAPDEAVPPAATRHFLLLFDLANSSPGTIERAGEAAKEFVNRQLGPRDLAAVSTFTAEAGARMVTNFTRDRVLLTNAIETLGNPSYFKVADPLMISAVRVEGPQAGGMVDASSRAGGEGVAQDLAREQERMARRSHDSEMRNRLRIQFSNLGKVAQVLDRLRGQKQVILLSEGFDPALVQGRETSTAGASATMDTVMSGEVWNVDNEERFGSSSSSNDVRDLTELFRRHDVVLHAIDIKGLRVSGEGGGAGGRNNTSESLHLITTPTGGTVFKNNNDIAKTFDKMLAQQQVVYLLGFQAPATGSPGKYHSLRVKAPNVRAARVVYRPGYYEANPKLTELERTLTLAEILMTDAPIEDIPVAIGATAIPGPKGKARLPVVMEIPAAGLLKSLAGRKASAHVYLYAFNESGQVVDHLEERVRLDFDSGGEALRQGVRYYGTLRVPAGKLAVKALVRVEETGLIGFKRADVDVPSFDKPAVSQPVMFDDPGRWAMLLGPARGDEFAYPFSAGDDKYIPRSAPELAPEREYKVALFLHRVPLENLAIDPRLVLADGSTQAAKVKLLGRTSPDESGSVKLLFGFSAPGVAAGRHELRFAIAATDGTRSEVSMPFIVR